jgi:uncharacterized membrane protein YqjE
MAGFSFGPSRLLGSVRATVDSLLSLLQTRLELASLELQEARQRFVGLLVLVVALFAMGLLALTLLTLALLVSFWDTAARIPLVWVFAVVYAAIAWGLFSEIRRRLKEAPPLFEATLSEIRKDRAWIREP